MPIFICMRNNWTLYLLISLLLNSVSVIASTNRPRSKTIVAIGLLSLANKGAPYRTSA